MTNEIVKSENVVATYSNEEIKLIHDRFAKNATEKEFELFLYTANKYQLDPLVKQIWCVKFAGQDAQIYAGRDGFLEIAHRSGQFNGLESGMKDPNTAYAKVFRKDMDNPFYVEVDMAEYNTNQALWKSKPITMLTKVAESQALRRAFSITGLYSPEEMGQWELQAQGISFDKTPPQKAVTTTSTYTQSSDFDWSKLDLEKKPFWGYGEKRETPKMIKRLFAISKKGGIPTEEFQSVCKNITNKEHSWEWTYGDIKNIEEALNQINEPDKPDEPEPEPEIIEADIEDATIQDFQELEKEFDVVNYAKEKFNIPKTGRELADEKIKNLKGNQ
jgi:phage recombination protein Bet